MGMKSLLGLALAAVAAMTLLSNESPATGRSARAATHAVQPSGQAAAAETTPEPVRSPRVVGTDGPVAGARVAFFRWRDTAPTVVTETDETGSFDLPEVEFRAVVVRAAGYPPKMFRHHEDLSDLRLDPGKIRKLTIADEEGNPGAYADVDIYGDYDLWLLLSSTRADERGVATLWLGGSEPILVRLRGYASRRIYNTDEPVVLRPGFSIAGQVVDTAGAPIPSATIDVDRSYG